jgi:hypothetical protein
VPILEEFMSFFKLEICFDVSCIVDCHFMRRIDRHLSEGLPEDGGGNGSSNPSSVDSRPFIIRKTAEDDRIGFNRVVFIWIGLYGFSEYLFFRLEKIKILVH